MHHIYTNNIRVITKKMAERKISPLMCFQILQPPLWVFSFHSVIFVSGFNLREAEHNHPASSHHTSPKICSGVPSGQLLKSAGSILRSSSLQPPYLILSQPETETHQASNSVNKLTASIKAIKDILQGWNVIINEMKPVLSDIFNTSLLLKNNAGLEARINKFSDKTKSLIGINSKAAQNQNEYHKLNTVDATITDKETRWTRAKEFIAILGKSDTITDSF